ncbi:ABC transporter permease [Salicibibacter cibi]|uniref:ABC transporter permease n=1 Tax=Salicibibacter cibi TaxID=2743001 RepID=A0A7T6ZAU8_9BACI|nr:ABC transporter permease [Salicibibacter cibi]QQK80032.1 ABC transporter permease [Salicibibacter cibi]
MSFIDSLKMALSSIWSHKMRSLLTMLGIIIGVGAIIAIVAIGRGGEAVLTSQFAGGGNNTFEVYYDPSDEEWGSGADPYSATQYTKEDIRAIEAIPTVEQVIAYAQTSTEIDYTQENATAQVVALNESYYQLNELSAVNGRLLDDRDVDMGRRIATVSEGLVEELFDNGENPIGQIVDIENTPFEIVGVFTRENHSLFDFTMDEVLIPQTVWPMLYGTDDMDILNVQATSADHIQEAGENTTQILNENHSLAGDYEVLNMEEIEEGISQVTNITTIIIGGVAGIALVVGGIGVMNIMLVSVTERTREIGLRKSLGATRSNILLQFLIEAMTLTTIGGLIGTGLGAGLANTVAFFVGWPSLVSIPIILLGVGFSMLIGIVFGLLPANKAAKLDPIEAMRYE